MLEIKGVNEEAFKHLIKIPPRFWSKSRFQPSSCYDTLVNNMSEAFNFVFVAARSKPIMTMLEKIRVYIMQIWESNRHAGEYDYEVRHTSLNGEKYVVNLYKKECSCRLWVLTGLPCCHAMSCMKDQHLEINDFVPDCYKKEQYAACYAHVIYPLNGEALVLLIFSHHQ
ncbi:unnamed protein product [Lathyrus sativus]|nr:unnamed protein product [Lathyrus sativus]